MTQQDVASLACWHIEIQNKRIFSIFFAEPYVFVCIIVVDTWYNLHKHKHKPRKKKCFLFFFFFFCSFAYPCITSSHGQTVRFVSLLYYPTQTWTNHKDFIHSLHLFTHKFLVLVLMLLSFMLAQEVLCFCPRKSQGFHDITNVWFYQQRW